jgi:hypothetical protein
MTWRINQTNAGAHNSRIPWKLTRKGSLEGTLKKEYRWPLKVSKEGIVSSWFLSIEFFNK